MNNDFSPIDFNSFTGTDDEKYQNLLKNYETNIDLPAFEKALNEYNAANPTAQLSPWGAITGGQGEILVRKKQQNAPHRQIALSPLARARAYALNELEAGREPDFNDWSDDDVFAALNENGGFKIFNENSAARKKLINAVVGEYKGGLEATPHDRRGQFFADKRAENINRNALQKLADFDIALRQLNLNEATALFNAGGKRDEAIASNLRDLIARGDDLGLELQIGDDAQIYYRQKGDKGTYARFDKEKFQGFTDELLSNGGKVAGSVAGSLLGAGLGGPIGALIGGALGSAGGGLIDNWRAARQTGKNADYIGDLLNDAALGAVGEGVAQIGIKPLIAGVKKASRVVGVAESAKNYITKSNPSAVEKVLKQRMNSDELAHAQIKAGVEFEPTAMSRLASRVSGALGGAVDDISGAAAQDARVLNAALSDTGGIYAGGIANALKDDIGAVMGARQLAGRVYDKISSRITSGGTTSGDMIGLIKGAIGKIERDYADKINSLGGTPVAIDKAATAAQLDDIAARATSRLLDGEAAPIIAKKNDLINFINKNENYDLQNLNDLRSAINRIYGTDDPSLKHFANMLREEVYQPRIKEVLGDNAGELAKQLEKYGEMLNAKETPTLQSLMNPNISQKSFKDALNALLESKSGEANQFTRVQKFLKGDDLAKFEKSVLDEQIERFTIDYKNGLKVFDSASLINKLNGLDVEFKSPAAKELLEFIEKYNADYGGLAHLTSFAKTPPKFDTSFNSISRDPISPIVYKMTSATGGNMLASVPHNSIIPTTLNALTTRMGVDFLQKGADIATKNAAARALRRNIVKLGEVGERAVPRQTLAETIAQGDNKWLNAALLGYRAAKNTAVKGTGAALGGEATKSAFDDFLERKIFEAKDKR